MTLKTLFKPSILLSCMALASHSFAAEIYKDDQKQLDVNISSWVGAFSSQENYYPTDKNGSQWTEGFVKYGVSGSLKTAADSSIYGAVAGVTSFVRGDGDMAGNSRGTEDKTTLEDAYIGWKSGNLLPVFGENGLDISFGSQVYHLGDGFLVTDDSANLGENRNYPDAESKMVSRGGAYYTAARRSFHKAAVIKIGQAEGLKTELAWVQSDNPIHASSEFASADVNYKSGPHSIGVDYIKFLDFNENEAALLNPNVFMRDNMQVYALRGSTNAGIENVNLSFNYSHQEKEKLLTPAYDVIDQNHNDNAWYASAGYNFAKSPWSPSLNYRYTHYSENWDPMFVGVEKLGTWIPGEVAGNFAGPFNSNSNIHMISVEAFPSEKLLLGANLYKFESIDTSSQPDYSGKELDLFAMYQVNQALSLIPIVGIYKPEKSAENNGSQVGSTKTNIFAGLIAAITY